AQEKFTLCVAFFAFSPIIPLMSLAELKEAVAALSPSALAELASFIRQRENSQWDREIDADFAESGRLRPVLEEVRENLRAGRLEDVPLPAGPTDARGSVLQRCLPRYRHSL